uniref:Uncharacterized protein n=1 Tax=Rhizophora mucronata TaxID=61149 RepID=A0A2P2IJA1_RHIMU
MPRHQHRAEAQLSKPNYFKMDQKQINNQNDYHHKNKT